MGRFYTFAADMNGRLENNVKAVIREHDGGVADHSERIWVLMMVEMWHHEVLGAAVPRADVAARARIARTT
jgi:hypothetical protein